MIGWTDVVISLHLHVGARLNVGFVFRRFRGHPGEPQETV